MENFKGTHSLNVIQCAISFKFVIVFYYWWYFTLDPKKINYLHLPKSLSVFRINILSLLKFGNFSGKNNVVLQRDEFSTVSLFRYPAQRKKKQCNFLFIETMKKIVCIFYLHRLNCKHKILAFYYYFFFEWKPTWRIVSTWIVVIYVTIIVINIYTVSKR